MENCECDGDLLATEIVADPVPADIVDLLVHVFMDREGVAVNEVDDVADVVFTVCVRVRCDMLIEGDDTDSDRRLAEFLCVRLVRDVLVTVAVLVKDPQERSRHSIRTASTTRICPRLDGLASDLHLGIVYLSAAAEYIVLVLCC